MFDLCSSFTWAHSNKNEKLEMLLSAVNSLGRQLQQERDARLRLLQYLDLKEVSGPRIVPVVPE